MNIKYQSIGEIRGKTPSALMALAILLLVLTNLFTFAHSNVAVGNSLECNKMQVKYLKKGWMNKDERTDYCFNGCTFLDVDCTKKPDKKFAWLRLLFNQAEPELMYQAFYDKHLNIPFDDKVQEIYFDILYHFWPLVFSILPIIASRLNFVGIGSFISIIATMALSWLFADMSYAIILHNILMAYVSLVALPSSSKLQELIIPFAVLLASVTLLFILPIFMQCFVLVILLFGFFAYLYNLFFKQRQGASSGALIVMSQVWIVFEEISYIRLISSEKSLLSIGIEAILNSIVPFGRTSSYFTNILRLTRSIIIRLPFEFDLAKAGIVVFFTQCFLFLAFRTCLGAYCIYDLRYKTDVGSLAKGLVVYMIGGLDSVIYAGRIFLGAENFTERRFFYACSNGLLMYYEVRYAREFAVLRIFVSILDKLIIQSKYGRAMHYLGYGIDYGGAAFPQENALPWIPFKVISQLCENVKVLTCQIDKDKFVKGVGFLMETAHNGVIYTIDHVVNKAEAFKFGNTEMGKPTITKVTSGFDPVVSISTGITGGADVCLLADKELLFITHLMIASVDDEGRVFMSLTTDFKVKDDDLLISVNLKRGDSGCPVFAVLKDGYVRYCGAVSKGSRDKGGGNIVSFVSIRRAGSISDSDDGNENPRDFNDKRKLSMIEKRALYDDACSLNNYLINNAVLVEEFEDWEYNIPINVIFRDSSSEIYTKFMLSVDRERPENKEKWDEKRARKNKATRKRQLGFLQNVSARLKNVYGIRRGKVLLKHIMSGNPWPLKAHEIASGPLNNPFYIIVDADATPDIWERMMDEKDDGSYDGDSDPDT